MPKDKFLLPVNQLCLCMCVGDQEKKSGICCLVRANYPDNWLQFLSSASGSLDKKQKHRSSGRENLISSLQTPGAPTPARAQELGCAVESGTEGHSCEELETRPGRRPQKSELAGLGFRVDSVGSRVSFLGYG